LFSRRFQVLTRSHGTNLPLPYLYPFTAENHPRLFLWIDKKRSIQSIPVFRSHRPFTMWLKRSHRAVCNQYPRSSPFIVFSQKGGKHIILSAERMNFRSPKIFFRIKITVWGEDWKRPLPMF